MFEPAKLQMNCASASGAMNARGDVTQLAVAGPEFAAGGLTRPCQWGCSFRRRRGGSTRSGYLADSPGRASPALDDPAQAVPRRATRSALTRGRPAAQAK